MAIENTNSLVKYKTLPLWTQATLPESFQTRHNTKSDTWGKIMVEAGQLQYDSLNEAGAVISSNIITADYPDFFVSPEAWHRVKPLGDLRCLIEFYCQRQDYFQKNISFPRPIVMYSSLWKGLWQTAPI